MEETKKCEVLVNRGGSRWDSYEKCGRPIERDGKCKLHIRVQERRVEKSNKWKEDHERGEALRAEADVLGASLGTNVSAYYSSLTNRYDGRFVVDGDWLRAQAKKLPPHPQKT